MQADSLPSEPLVRYTGQQEKDIHGSHLGNLPPGGEGYTAFCLKKDSKSGLLLGKTEGDVGHMEHPRQVRSRRWKGSEYKAREMAPKGRKGG